MNISSVSKYIFVCVFLCFGAFWWFCIIQHSFIDDRAYLYHVKIRTISLPQKLLIGIVKVFFK